MLQSPNNDDAVLFKGSSSNYLSPKSTQNLKENFVELTDDKFSEQTQDLNLNFGIYPNPNNGIFKLIFPDINDGELNMRIVHQGLNILNRVGTSYLFQLSNIFYKQIRSSGAFFKFEGKRSGRPSLFVENVREDWKRYVVPTPFVNLNP